MKVFKVDTDGTQKLGDLLASESPLDTTNFDKNLDTTITDVQKLADAVDEFDISSLPTPTLNKLLRANGTNWVATINSSLTDGNNDAGIEIVNNVVPANRYARMRVMTDTSQMILSRSLYKTITSYINDSESNIFMESDNGKYLRLYSHSYDKGITLRPVSNGDNQVLNIQTTQTYSATSKIFEFFGKFEIYQNGKIVSNYLSGSTNQLLEALPDGTIQRYTGTIPSAQVNSDWNATSGVAEILNKPNIPTNIPNRLEFLSDPLAVISDAYAFSNTQLGLDGINLNDKVKMVQCYVIQADYPNVKNNELVMGHNIEDGQISVILNFNLAVGDRIKIYIEYID